MTSSTKFERVSGGVALGGLFVAGHFDKTDPDTFWADRTFGGTHIAPEPKNLSVTVREEAAKGEVYLRSFYVSDTDISIDLTNGITIWFTLKEKSA